MDEVNVALQRVMREIDELRTEMTELASRPGGRTDDEEARLREVAYRLRIADDDRAALADRSERDRRTDR